MKKSSIAAFKKFYIFSHKNGEDIKQCVVDGNVHSWVFDLAKATFFNTESDAEDFAKTEITYRVEGRNYVIGCVVIDIDPLYSMKVI